MEKEIDRACLSISTLPEGCISNIISLTSPKDATRAAAISRRFMSAAESDSVWERFLPSDYQEIISKSASPLVYSTKKQLFSSLCTSPILLDDGSVSFSLSKWSGKKCFMLRARELLIASLQTPEHCNWACFPESRFSEVALFNDVCWLDIHGRMPTRMLSPNTTYAAYLVFKIAENSQGLEFPSQASVRVVTGSGDRMGNDETRTVYLKSPPRRRGLRIMFRYLYDQESGWFPKLRTDGWMEVELGEFFNEESIDGEVEMRLLETDNLNWKSGLIVEGIELRPKSE